MSPTTPTTPTTARRLKARVFSMALPVWLPLVALVVPTAVTLAPAVARADIEKAECKVHAVHALKEGDGSIPKELKFIEEELRSDQFAAYKGFRLLEAKSLKLVLNKASTTSMKTGHKLGLSLLGGKDRLKLHAKLTDRKGSGSLVDLDYTIENGGVFMIGGSTYKGGRLFFAIQCMGR